MPVQYQSIRKEHLAVRKAVGMFDVSHMGEFIMSGPEALQLLQQVTVNDASVLEPGRAQYTVMCYEHGGIVDDLIVYMLDENKYMMVVNASNIEKDFEWIQKHNSFDATLENRSEEICLLAVQGPDSVKTLQKLTECKLADIGFYRFAVDGIAGLDRAIISATGYTGEKGFELYFEKDQADPEAVWNAIVEAGEEFGIEPCGLGARDTLRLEMGFPLYGNDLGPETNPLEARLGWLTKLDKGDFIGREALLEVKEKGPERLLMGFVTGEKRAIPRAGYPLLNDGDEQIGTVTSGSLSVSLDIGIGMGYMDTEFAREGSAVYVQVRNKKQSAKVIKPPFVEK